MNCIFCKQPFDPSTTKPEHILLDAMGGKKTTRGAICSACNHRSGCKLDCLLTDSVAQIRTLFDLRSGSGDPAPSWRGIALSTGEKIDLLPGGTPQTKKVVYERTKTGEGKTNIRIEVSSIEELYAKADQFAKGAGVTREQFLEQVKAQGFVQGIRQVEDPIPLQTSFGGWQHLLLLTKMAFVLWTEVVGNEELHDPAYDEARKLVHDFLYHDIKPPQDIGKTDARIPPLKLPGGDRWGEIFNFIYISSNGTGEVRALFRLYNTFNLYVKLATNAPAKNRSIFLLSNPETLKWDWDEDANVGVSWDWLDPPQMTDMAPLQEALARLFKRGDEIQIETAVGRIFEKAAKLFEERPDVELSERIAMLAQEVSYGMVSLRQKLGRPIPISEERLQQRIQTVIERLQKGST